MFQGLKRRVGDWFSRSNTDVADPDLVASCTHSECVAPEALRLHEQGVRLLEEARAADALACFEAALSACPDFAEAHNHTGLTLMELGRYSEAVASFQRAVDIRYNYVQALSNQGAAYRTMGQHEDAEDCLNLALAFDADFVEAHFNLGMSCWDQGKQREAIAHFEKVIELDGESAETHLNLGMLYFRQNQFERALSSFRTSGALRPGISEIFVNCGLALLKLGRVDEAISEFERALALHPDNAEAFCQLGNAYVEREAPDRAIISYQRAVAIKPDYPDALTNLGNALKIRGEINQAVECYRRALAIRPEDPMLHHNLGFACSYQDRLEEAVASFDTALQYDPDHVEARLNLGIVRLLLGDFLRGWEGYEWRFRQRNPDYITPRRDFPYREWRGEDLAGQRLLIWGEQGIGDELRNASMFAEVSEAARRCVIECAPKLLTLFARSFPAATVVARTDPPHRETQGPFDFQSAAGSLARWRRLGVASFPDRRAYLRLDPLRAAYWKERLAALGGGLKVGFSWRSSNLKGTRALICTKLDQWRPILSVAGVQFVSLQYDECREELAQAEERFGVRLHRFPEVDLFNDIEEATALTGALDLVITAPTAVSVLAAALGISTWRTSYGPDWQLHGTNRNLWHPSMVIFRRRWDQRWEEVIDAVGNALAQFVAGREP